MYYLERVALFVLPCARLLPVTQPALLECHRHPQTRAFLPIVTDGMDLSLLPLAILAHMQRPRVSPAAFAVRNGDKHKAIAGVAMVRLVAVFPGILGEVGHVLFHAPVLFFCGVY